MAAQPHRVVSLVLLVVLLAGAVYVLSLGSDPTELPAHAIESACQPGMACASRGLTRAFVALRAGELDVALAFNRHALRIALFFGVQVLMRIRFLLPNDDGTEVRHAWMDVGLSLAFALWAFGPLVWQATP